MRFSATDRAETSQVEDRRGMRFPGGMVGAGGGLGLVGLVIVFAAILRWPLALGEKTSNGSIVSTRIAVRMRVLIIYCFVLL